MLGAAEIASIARNALRAAADALDHEQAVHGLDALTEVELHAILADGFAEAGIGILRERPFPGEPAERPPDPQRERCDLVLLPSSDAMLQDPLETIRERDRAAGTLFEQLAREDAPDAAAIGPDQACWIEVKTVGQFTYVEGVPGPNRRYASELMACRRDLVKLARDRFIECGGLLLVLLTADEPTARHDLSAFLHRALDRGIEFGSPEIEGFGITDRIGNAHATITLVPIRAAPNPDAQSHH